MKLKEIITKLKLDNEFLEIFSPFEKQALKNMPEKTFFFLEPDYYLEAAKFCGLDESVNEALQRTAQKILEDKNLTAMAWLCYYLLFKTDANINKWPEFKQVIGDDFGIFYLLIALAMVGKTKEIHAQKDVNFHITRETCHEINCFCQNHLVAHQVPGILHNQLSWLRNYPSGRLFRLGRMEYRLEKLTCCGRVFSNLEDGRKIMLAEDGQYFNREGYIDATLPAESEENWTARLKEDGNLITGFPITPEGKALKQEISLDATKWKPLLKPGDEIIEMHIPSGGGMSPEKCLDSLRQAFDFFHKMYPESILPAVCCQSSWIFNTQLEEAMPESNLAKFMREIYLFPVASKGKDGLWFVFCKEYEDWSQAPRQTSLQKAMLDVVCSGRKLRSAGMFFFENDLEYYGTGHYRKTWQL